jgi:hypothetical protein
MGDQELLELAARAAGLNVKAQSVNADDRWIGLIVGEKHTRERKFWNPLTDDGDALRLTVELNLGCIFNGEEAVVWRNGMEVLEPTINNDPYAATRRAIVRAAAEIGKTMGEQE